MDILNKADIVAYARNGFVQIRIAGTDCDGGQFDYFVQLKVEEAETWAEIQLDWADGPMTIWVEPMR
jgi:hypothetical protein